MAMQTVLQLGDPKLREVASPVADARSPEIATLVRDLADTLAHWRATTGYGRGIAAPQIGVAQRVIFLQLPGAEPWPLVNPEIIWRSAEKIVVWDACLSFLSIFMQVERHREIRVRYQVCAGSGRRFRRARSGIFRNCCSTRLIIWTGFWRWIELRICGRCARGRSLRRDTGRGVLMRWGCGSSAFGERQSQIHR